MVNLSLLTVFVFLTVGLVSATTHNNDGGGYARRLFQASVVTPGSIAPTQTTTAVVGKVANATASVAVAPKETLPASVAVQPAKTVAVQPAKTVAVAQPAKATANATLLPGKQTGSAVGTNTTANKTTTKLPGTGFSQLSLPASVRDAPESQSCAWKPIVVVYGGAKPDLSPMMDDQPPIDKLDVTNNQTVEFINLNSPNCDISKVQKIGGNLIIWDDGNLPEQFGGQLSELKGVMGQLVIYGALGGKSRLRTLEGLENLEAVGKTFALLRLPKLKDFTGLGALTYIGGSFALYDLASLRNFVGIGPVPTIGSRLFPEALHALEDFTGLESLKTIEWDFIAKRNYKLKSLKGLDNVEHVGGEVGLINNVALETTADMGKLKTVGISVAVMNSPKLSDLVAFTGLTQVKGDLALVGLHALEDLSPLSKVGSVKLNLVVSDCNKLKNLEGLQNIKTVGYLLDIGMNDNLESLEGLAMTTVGQDVYIADNPRLATLSSLSGSLTRIGTQGGGRLTILNNKRLVDTAGWENTLQVVNGNVILKNNGVEMPGIAQKATVK